MNDLAEYYKHKYDETLEKLNKMNEAKLAKLENDALS